VEMKCLKKWWVRRKLEHLMKSENTQVRKACEKRDWKKAEKWLHINKASFKAFRRLQQL